MVKPKIVLIGSYPPTIGGISTHLKNLQYRLIENAYEVKVIDAVTQQKDQARDIINGNSIVNLFSSVKRLIKNKYSIFHFHTSKRARPLLLLLPLLKIYKKKIYLSIHHGGFNEWISEKKLRQFIYIILLKHVDKIIFMNKNDAHKVSLLLGEDYKNNIYSIPPFIIPDKNLISAEYNKIVTNEFRVTTLGLWRSFCNYEDLMKSCQYLVREKKITVDLDIVVGGAFLDEEYKTFIHDFSESNKSESLQITIHENKNNIIEYLKTQDVLVRGNSVDSYGLCVAEALMVGTPAIATNVCTRTNGALLYAPKNIEQLSALLFEVYQNRSNIKKSLLLKEEDAFLLLEMIYKN